MAVSFLDLPVELMLLQIKFIDNVPTLKSMLSIKEVREQLASHVKIVLDYRGKNPVAFPFQDTFEVIRATSIQALGVKFVYLVEIDMSERSFYSDAFYADSNGNFPGLKSALLNYASPRSYICLSISDPVNDWASDLQMYSASKSLLNVFTGTKFAGVHIKPSGTPLRTRSYQLSDTFTYGEVLPLPVECYLQTGTWKTVPYLKCPSRTVLNKFLHHASTVFKRFSIATDPHNDWKDPSGHLLTVRKYTWDLKNRNWKKMRQLNLGTIHVLENVSLEMGSGVKTLEFDYPLDENPIDWDLKLQMASPSLFDTSPSAPASPPSITKFQSTTLNSLAMESYVAPPTFSEVYLPNLSALSLKIHATNQETSMALSRSMLECFRASKIEYLYIVQFEWLKRCCFMSNLSRLEGLALKTQEEMAGFKNLRFPHLHTLQVHTSVDGVPSTQAPKLQKLSWTLLFSIGRAGLDLVSNAYPKLTHLLVEAENIELSIWATFENLKSLHMKFAHSTVENTIRTTTKSKQGTGYTMLRIKAPMLEVLKIDYVRGLRETTPSFELSEFPNLEKFYFTGLASLKVSKCPVLTKVYGLESNVSFTTFVQEETPELRFISYVSDFGFVNHGLTEKRKTPVFFIRENVTGKALYWMYEWDVPEGEDARIVDLFTSKEISETYSKTIEGYDDWKNKNA